MITMGEDTITEVDASTVEADAGKTAAPSQEKRSETDKAAFSLRKNAERARELGLDPAEILGTKTHIETNVEDEDNKPVTVGMLRTIQRQDAQKTSLQLANDIPDAETRNAVIDALTTRLAPSGDAEDDFRFALAAVSAPKNAQILQEINRYSPPKRTAAGGSMPAHVEEEFTPTSQEAVFMAAPYNLTKEQVIAARKAHADKQK